MKFTMVVGEQWPFFAMRFVALHGHGMNPDLFRSLLKRLLSKGPFKRHKTCYVKGWHRARGDRFAYCSDGKHNRFASYSDGKHNRFAYFRYDKRDCVVRAEQEYPRLDSLIGDEHDNIFDWF